MRHVSRVVSFGLPIGVALLVVSSLAGLPRDSCAADGWSYTLMNTAPLGGSPGGSWLPAINNAGQVVYFSEEEIESGSWRAGIHVSDGVSDQAVLEFTGPSGSFQVQGLGLDDSGDVAFYGRIPGETETGTLLYRVVSGQPVRVPVLDPEIVARASADLNENGELALHRSSFLGEGQAGERMRVIDANETASDQFIFPELIWSLNGPSAPVLNDRGDVGIFVLEVGPFPSRLRYRLWRRSAGQTEDRLLLAPAGGSPDGLMSEHAGFNDQGFASTSVAFGSPGQRLLLWVPSGITGLTPGVVTLIDTAEPGSAISQLGQGSAMTNNNVVAFSGAEAGGSTSGIFVRSPAGETIPVVLSGESVLTGFDPVDAFPLASDILRTRSLNEQGQLAFLGRFDGVWQVVRAEAAPGLLPDRPVLPDPGDFLPGGGWDLGRERCGGVIRCWVDPPLAVGYRFTIAEADPGAFADVTIPAPLPKGDALFAAEFNGISVPLVAGSPLVFSVHTNEPVREFLITGIDEAEALDAEDPNAFVTGLTFAAGSSPDLHFSMVPVPEPGIALGSLAGLLCVRVLGRRRSR